MGGTIPYEKTSELFDNGEIQRSTSNCAKCASMHSSPSDLGYGRGVIGHLKFLP